MAKIDLSTGTGVAVPFTFATGSPMVLQAVAAGQVVTRAAIVVSAGFDDPDATVELGTSATPGLVLASSDVDPAVPAQYETDVLTPFPSSDHFLLTIAPGASTQGAGTLYYWVQ